jgi:putative transposase
VFITWRLFGSLPSSGWGLRKDASEAFRHMDRTLDKAAKGPLWLKDARVAKCVVEAFQYGEREAQLYDLFAFAVIANHVHILIQPKAELSKITKTIKGFTSRQANRILERTGQPFWQDESFDHWIRNKDELNRTIRYIERNPVSAGLAQRIEDYPWSSAYQE